MNNTIQLELTKDEREILLQGLRFVRSSLMMEMRDPSNDDENWRAGQLEEIAELMLQLNGNAPSLTPAEV